MQQESRIVPESGKERVSAPRRSHKRPSRQAATTTSFVSPEQPPGAFTARGRGSKKSKRKNSPRGFSVVSAPGRDAFGLNQPGRVLKEGYLRNRILRSIGSDIRRFYLKPTKQWFWYGDDNDIFYYKPRLRGGGPQPPLSVLRQVNFVTGFAECDIGIAEAYEQRYKLKYGDNAVLEEDHHIDVRIVSQMHKDAAERYNNGDFTPIPSLVAQLMPGFLCVRVGAEVVSKIQFHVSALEDKEFVPSHSTNVDTSMNSDGSTPLIDTPASYAAARVSLSPSKDGSSNADSDIADSSDNNVNENGSSPRRDSVGTEPRASSVAIKEEEDTEASTSQHKDEIIHQLRQDLEQKESELQNANEKWTAGKQKYHEIKQELDHETQANKKLQEDIKALRKQVNQDEVDLAKAKVRQANLELEILQLKQQQQQASQHS